MIHSIYLSLENILIRQIPLFYNIFIKYDDRYIYSYKYKGIHFIYFKMSRCLYIRTEIDKILNRNNITLKDKDEFIRKVISIVKEFVKIDEKDISFKICRCDYKVDLQLTSLEMDNIFILLNKHRTSYRYIKAHKRYDTSISLSNPSASTKINIYDKGVQSKLAEFKDVLRVELQIKNRKIHKLHKKDNIERDINLYWTKEFMEELYFKYYENFLYKGNYYKLSIAKELILNSSYTKTIKQGLIKFITNVHKKGMTKSSKDYSYNTIKRYIEYLNNININPITISDDCGIDEIESIFNRIRKISEETYFNI